MNWSLLVMNHICPALGCLTSGLMFAAPIRDLKECIVNGSLASLNPVPWAIMTGNCFGWVVYAYYKQDPYILASNLPGFLISLWLNAGAAKIQYLEQTKKSSTQDDSLLLLLGPQERLLSRVVLLWSAIIVLVGFVMPSSLYSPAEVIGFLVNLNLIFYYAAPLESIVKVVRTKNSNIFHVPSILMNIINTSFWVAYGTAKMDPIIILPNGLGLFLALAQGSVCLVYPSTTEEDEDDDDEDVEACNEKSSLKRYQTQTTSRMSSLTD